MTILQILKIIGLQENYIGTFDILVADNLYCYINIGSFSYTHYTPDSVQTILNANNNLSNFINHFNNINLEHLTQQEIGNILVNYFSDLNNNVDTDLNNFLNPDEILNVFTFNLLPITWSLPHVISTNHVITNAPLTNINLGYIINTSSIFQFYPELINDDIII